MNGRYIPFIDQLYSALMREFYDSGAMTMLTIRGKRFDAVGKDSFCVWEEMFAVQEFINMLVIVSSRIDPCIYTNILDDESIDCAVKMFSCQYGELDMLIDKLLEITQTSGGSGNGDYYLNEDGTLFLQESGGACAFYILES